MCTEHLCNRWTIFIDVGVVKTEKRVFEEYNMTIDDSLSLHSRSLEITPKKGEYLRDPSSESDEIIIID